MYRKEFGEFAVEKLPTLLRYTPEEKINPIH